MTEEKRARGRWAKKRQRRQNKKVESYRKSAFSRLQTMLEAGLGANRAEDKAEGTTQDKIYSKTTFKTYKHQFRYFANWLEENHADIKTLDEARAFVDDYLTYLIEQDRSAYSITTAKAALAKVFQVESTQFRDTPMRSRANVKRSREAVDRDRHISDKKEAELARFTSATGLRRAEMLRIEASDLFFRDGRAYLNVHRGTKGGRPRVAEIVGSSEDETREIVRWIQSKKGRGRLFPTLSSHYDNHYYRATYANRVYNKYARDVNSLQREEKYIMRNERAGETFDKQAMLVASRMLGHNRISVIAQSYLYQ